MCYQIIYVGGIVYPVVVATIKTSIILFYLRLEIPCTDHLILGWNTVPFIWSNAEVSVGIICACLPILRPLIQAASRNFFGESKLEMNEYTHWPSQYSKTAGQNNGLQQDMKVPVHDQRSHAMLEEGCPAYRLRCLACGYHQSWLYWEKLTLYGR